MWSRAVLSGALGPLQMSRNRLGPGTMMAAPEDSVGEMHATEDCDTKGCSIAEGAGTSCDTLDVSWSLSEHAGPPQKGAALWSAALCFWPQTVPSVFKTAQTCSYLQVLGLGHVFC